MDKKQSIQLVVTILLVTIIIDVMGMGLVFPMMPELFTSDHPLLIAETADPFMKSMLYGIAMAVWSMGFFFGTPYIGDLSDKMGRKRAIIVCLFLTAVGYFLAVLALLYHSAFLFMISRFVVGFFGGSFSVAQAVIADISSPKDKMRNMGWISLAGSLGMVIGPLLIILLDMKLFSNIGSIPIFIAAALLPLLNLIFFKQVFQETYIIKGKVKFEISKAFTSFTVVFMDMRTRLLMTGLFLFELGWGFYIQGIPMVLGDQYGLSHIAISWFFVVLGSGFSFGILFIQPRLVKILSIRDIALFAGVSAGCLLFLALIIGELWALTVLSFIFCVLEVSLYTGYMALFSNAVTEFEQGKTMGGVGAAIGGAWTINALLLGPLYEIHPLLLLFIASSLFILSALCLFFLKARA